MLVTFNNQQIDFRPWRPELGRVFGDVYAFDSETALIDEERPWVTPPFVLGAVCDGQRGYFLQRSHIGEFFEAHRNIPAVMHNAAFDLDVLNVAEPGFDIYHLVDTHLVWDTQLLHRLYTLGTEGHTSQKKGMSTLEFCAEYYLRETLEKDVCDAEGRDIRMNWGRWLSRPPSEIGPVYLEYLAKDVIATLLVFERQREHLRELLNSRSQVWGYVSPQWLAEQVRKWGWQTHHIQLKTSIVLRAVTANGIGIDVERRDELEQQLDELLDELRGRLRPQGYLPGEKGSGKALQEILRSLERKHRSLSFPRTATNKYATSREALAEIAEIEPFVRDVLYHKETEKLKSSFLNKMVRRRLHPSFNPLMVSGRTSSFGEINAQNLPRDDRVRSCFVASPGHVFIDADYSTVEMATLAQVVLGQLRIPSHMASAINRGVDLHRLVASHVTGTPEDEVSDEERRKAKPINFGKPGGMGHDGLKRYAKSSYAVELSDEEVERLSDSWFTLFPEMRDFLVRDIDLGEAVARLFELTAQSYYEHTGSSRYLDRCFNENQHQKPNEFFGWMCLKTLRVEHPMTRREVPYSDEEIDFFWSQVAKKAHLLPTTHFADATERRPSIELSGAVRRIVDQAPCFTFTGRLRARASFCARHNTVFQGLAADGAKLGLWALWRAGYRIANFIHDEVLIEVRDDQDLAQHAETIRRLMVEGMRAVVPEVHIDIEYAAARRWYKSAKAMYDSQGRLVPWEPDNVVHSASADGRGAAESRSQAS